MTDPTPPTPDPSVPPAYTPSDPTAEKRGLSIAAFVLGIVSVVFAIPVAGLGIAAGVVGLILALLARTREPASPRWMKLLGLILSIVGLVVSVITIILTVVALAAITSNSGS